MCVRCKVGFFASKTSFSQISFRQMPKTDLNCQKLRYKRKETCKLIL